MIVRVVALTVLLCALSGVSAQASPTPGGPSGGVGLCEGAAGPDTGQFRLATWGLPVKAISATNTCTSAWVYEALTELVNGASAPTVIFYLPPGVSATISWDALKLLPEAPLKRDGAAVGGGSEPCDPNYRGIPSYIIEGNDLLVPITCP